MLIRFKASTITAFLTTQSTSASVVKEGEWFTSNNQGLRSESKITSNPRISKHMLLVGSSGWQDL